MTNIYDGYIDSDKRKPGSPIASNVFSYTAPFVSIEEERKAKESLSESDLQRIHNDLFGIRNRSTTATNDKNLEEVDEKADTSCRQAIHDNCSRRTGQSFQRVLGHELIRESLEQLPTELNDAYRVAMERNPSLLDSNECNWDYFLHTHKDNVWVAAEAIAYYWSLRRTTFGDEQYCKCMTFEKDGCMYDIKKEFAFGGFRIDGYDNHGRPVLYLDIKTCTDVHRDIIVQIVFFWVHQLMYNRHQLPYVTTTNNNAMVVPATSNSKTSDSGESIDATALNHEPIFYDCVNSRDDSESNTFSSIDNKDATSMQMPQIVDDVPSHLDYSYIAIGNFKVCYTHFFANF